MKTKFDELPKFTDLMKPVLKALKERGGSGTNKEIYEKVIELLDIPDNIVEELHGDSNTTEIEYRMAWSRTYLRKIGLIESSKRGVWSIKGDISEIVIEDVDPKNIVKRVKEIGSEKVSKKIQIKNNPVNQTDPSDELPEIDDDDLDESESWRDELQKILLDIKPDAFERLAQRLLRESGFTQVQVTGKSGDGGIDGKGILSVQGILSFHVFFQCKRYRGSVSAGSIRDFRGAMQGRADKGLFITTGTFTRDAIREASRDGAPPIDLIDGEDLLDKLKELNIGIDVREKTVEEVIIKEEYFRNI